MTDEKRNLPASVAARLLNRAKQTGDDYQTLFANFCFERFLYRLALEEKGVGYRLVEVDFLRRTKLSWSQACVDSEKAWARWAVFYARGGDDGYGISVRPGVSAADRIPIQDG